MNFDVCILKDFFGILLLIKVLVEEGCILVLQTLNLNMVLNLEHISAK